MNKTISALKSDEKSSRARRASAALRAAPQALSTTGPELAPVVFSVVVTISAAVLAIAMFRQTFTSSSALRELAFYVVIISSSLPVLWSLMSLMAYRRAARIAVGVGALQEKAAVVARRVRRPRAGAPKRNLVLSDLGEVRALELLELRQILEEGDRRDEIKDEPLERTKENGHE